MGQDWTLIQNRLQDAAAFMGAAGKPGWAELANDALLEIRALERKNAQLLEALRKIEKMPWPNSESPYALIARAAIKAAEEE